MLHRLLMMLNISFPVLVTLVNCAQSSESYIFKYLHLRVSEVENKKLIPFVEQIKQDILHCIQISNMNLVENTAIAFPRHSDFLVSHQPNKLVTASTSFCLS